MRRIQTCSKLLEPLQLKLWSHISEPERHWSLIAPGFFRPVSDHMASNPPPLQSPAKYNFFLEMDNLIKYLRLQASDQALSTVLPCGKDDSVVLPNQLHPAPPIDLILHTLRAASHFSVVHSA